MGRWKASEWCGVAYCWNETRAKGLCATHHKQHTEHGLHTQVVANNEITRLFLQKPTRHITALNKHHRKFAATLPIPKDQQLALTKALNSAARRRGVVK